MGILAWIFGGLGGLCAMMGIATAAEIAPVLGEQYTTMFWFVLSVILLLICIAFAVSQSQSE